ncbi:hypothetical protein [Cyclobacterium plantarum]|uniref:Lipoprotein n=1 Tax=Cyclobacterium plantarum TaxID=2716263 RepID=A0ABX0HBD0_9BACT|nr:hypothetical protein [Cyclobacterium plantarum]NHE58989.1 hypothetical protein [Cyclobacterium plantarum]
MKTHAIILLALALLTGSCGLIDDKDAIPKNRENAEMIKSDDTPARGGR